MGGPATSMLERVRSSPISMASEQQYREGKRNSIPGARLIADALAMLAVAASCSPQAADTAAADSEGAEPATDAGDDDDAIATSNTSPNDDATSDDATDEARNDDPSGEDGSLPESIGYWEHIKPVLDGRCVSCHSPDGVGSFPLTTYEQARAIMPASMPTVHARLMPPWPPVDDCAEYLGDRSLTTGEIALLQAWVDAGMPEGDPTKAAPAPEVEDPLSRIDLELAMAAPYVPTQTPDDYHCFLLEWPASLTETTYLTGFGVDPGNAAIVHHVIAFQATAQQRATYEALDAGDQGPGYRCFGGSGGPAQTIGAWVPGSLGADFPAGTGIAIEPGSTIILQVHYNTLGGDDPSTTRLQFKLDGAVETPVSFRRVLDSDWLGGAMLIPAGESDVAFSTTVAGSRGGGATMPTIYRAALHMHMLGRSGRITVVHQDGQEECLLQIDDWDFSWQGSYELAQPRVLQPGDRIRLDCRFDNSVENQPYIGGVRGEPRDVNWGEGTSDEMCLASLMTNDL